MEKKEALEATMEYRNNLIMYGKKVILENPDNLTKEEIKALEERIFKELNKIDMSLGYPYHDVGMTVPAGISKEQQEILFIDFIDWYQVIPTPSGQIYKYVIQNYSLDRYSKVLCVGDGEKCHLGRKLAMKGYSVVSVDPVAAKNFSGKLGDEGRKLHVVKGEFYRNSTDMIDWANLIVGSKIPQCAEELIVSGKSAVFNISNNAEIYNMRFKGNLIQSSKQLIGEIDKCEGVSLKKIKDILGEESILFVCEERKKEQEKGIEI